jgi:glycosyltransferase involved in cell wall biosynthesis
MNILILHSQVPFVSGGAEVLVQGLSAAIANRGHDVDIVAVPLAWNPPAGLLTTAMSWRLLDIRQANNKTVDLVICTKYPTWAAQHPRKALWLVHQHRQAYDLYGTPLSEFTPDPASAEIRRRVFDIDRVGIRDCRPRNAISQVVADRLRRYCGIHAGVLHPPVPRTGLRAESFAPFILSVGRLDAAKRVRALLDAWPRVESGLSLQIAGDGPDRDELERLVATRGLNRRVTFLGRVDDARLRELFNTCRGVYYAPLDEDFGYAAVEALAAGKPVITATDSGGVLEFVADNQTGIVTTLKPVDLAAAIDRLADEKLARWLGAAGPARVADLTWDRVVDELLAV